MIKWFQKLSISYKTALLAAMLVFVGLLITMFGYFTKMPDIPNGLILGGLIGILSYLLMGLVEPYDERRKKPILTIVVTIIRFLLIAVTITLSALLWYKAGYHIFNLIFEVVGYTLSLVSFIIVYLLEKQNV